MNLDPDRPDRPSAIAPALDDAGRRLRLNALALGAAGWLAAALGLWLALCLLDQWLRLPPGLRLPAAAGAAAFLAAGFMRQLWRPAGRRLPRERVALELERRFGIAHNALINAYQFERRRNFSAGEQALASRVIAATRDAVARRTLEELVERRRVAKRGAFLLAAAVLWLVYAGLFPEQAWNACLRCALPLADIPPAGSIRLAIEPARDIAVREGDSLRVRARLDRPWARAPEIAWREGAASVGPSPAGGGVLKSPMANTAGVYTFAFNDLRRPFAFRVFAGDTYSRSVRVAVRPAPKIEGASFTVTPPAYTGLEPDLRPGPPALLAALPGSRVTVALDIRPAGDALAWKARQATTPFTRAGTRYQAEISITSAGPYVVEAAAHGTPVPHVLARGQISLLIDNPPSIGFLTADRNRFVTPGAEVALELEAVDDYGIARMAVTVRGPEETGAGRRVKDWHYLGPPGPRGPTRETLVLRLDPAAFPPGSVHVLEAWAADFCPRENLARSSPVILRIKALDELAAAPETPLAQAMAALREAVELQKKANSIAENLRANLPEILARGSLADHKSAAGESQTKAGNAAARAATEFGRQPEGKAIAGRLETLAQGEIPWVLKDLAALPAGSEDLLRQHLAPILERQAYILAELIALLGRSADRLAPQPPPAPAASPDEPPATAARTAGKDLRDDLKKFAADQQRVLERTKSLLEGGPEDLTKEEESILGALAREEAGWAAFFEEKLTDFSKLPLQDFADASLAEEFNKVFMEVKKASQALYARKTELAVPLEQSGLENARHLQHNLERWLADAPDSLKWNMEEPAAPPDAALAELPAELEDIVGALLDREEEMTEEVEDVTSSWLDSIDKGAGWDAMDGPISSMSAKGVTGNLLPNQQEVGGRSGEGRTGRSSGQMAADRAEGKEGRETPTRLMPNPFEQGSVEDTSGKDPGGATGGGKLSGFAPEGLRGPSPRLRQAMERLAGGQAAIRQEAEPLALALRERRLPSGDLETAIAGMRRLERAARDGSGPDIRRSFSRILDALQDAQRDVRSRRGLRREDLGLPQSVKDEILKGLQDGIPPGYEEMAEAYFKALAELMK